MKLLQNISDEEWLAIILGRSPRTDIPANLIPLLPPREVQVSTVGRSGEAAITEGMRFVSAVKKATAEHYKPITPECRVLDFGAGWGRMAMFMSKELDIGNMFCADPTPEWLAHTAKQLKTATCLISNPYPPIALPNASFDLIYAYSVFSHLSEVATNRWIEEFARILKPGGIAALTTRARSHLETGGMHRNINRSVEQDVINKEVPILLDRYDQGDLIYLPSTSLTGLTGDFFGETAIPIEYAKKTWQGQLDLKEVVTDYGAIQPIMILVKPEASA